MQNHCVACRKQFHDGDQVQRLPPLEEIRRGEKSGLLGAYPLDNTPEDDQDLVHHDFGCYEIFFSPADNPFLFDAIVKQVEEARESEIRDEIRDELATKFEEVKEMISERNFNFCVDCWANLDEDEPPYCLWCKDTQYVWMHQTPQGMILCCTRCNKYWNDQEEELSPPR
jgi:hypothetical protein